MHKIIKPSYRKGLGVHDVGGRTGFAWDRNPVGYSMTVIEPNTLASAVFHFFISMTASLALCYLIWKHWRSFKSLEPLVQLSVVAKVILCFLCMSDSYITGRSNWDKAGSTAEGLGAIVLADTIGWYAILSLAGKGGWRVLRVSRREGSFTFFLSGLALFFNYVFLFEALGVKEVTTNRISHDVFDSMYFTVATWTTVGYGDFIPYDGWTKFVAAAAALNGYVVLAVLISALLPIFMTTDA